MLKKKDKGFTLIEMLVVVSIITLLIAFIIVVVVGITKRANVRKTEALIERLSMAVKDYFQEFRSYPQPGLYPTPNQSLTYLLRNAHTIYDPDDPATIRKQLRPFIEFKEEELNDDSPPKCLDSFLT